MREEDLRSSTQKAAQKRKQRLSSKLSKGEKKGSKRMATVAAVYTIKPFERTPEQVEANLMGRLRLVKPQRPRPEHKRVWASLQKEPKEVMGEVFDEALGRDPNQQKQWIALVDGNKTGVGSASCECPETFSPAHHYPRSDACPELSVEGSSCLLPAGQ